MARIGRALQHGAPPCDCRAAATGWCGTQGAQGIDHTMHHIFATAVGAPPTPIRFVTAAPWGDIRAALAVPARAFADAAGFEPKAGRHLLLPAQDGALACVLFGLDAPQSPARDPFAAGRLPGLLPAGIYRFADPSDDARLAPLALALGSYRFTPYRQAADKAAPLQVPHRHP